LKQARSINHAHWRVMALAGVCAFLPADQSIKVAREAFRSAQKQKDNIFKAEEMTTLFLHLYGNDKLTALRAARDAAARDGGSHLIARTLIKIIPELPEAEQAEAFKAAEKAVMGDLFFESDRKSFSDGLAICYAGLGFINEAREWLGKNSVNDADALLKLIPHLMEADREQVMWEVHETALNMKGELPPASIALVVPYLHADIQDVALQKALDLAEAIKDSDVRARSITALSPSLAELGRKNEALSAAEAVRRISDPTEQNSAKKDLAIGLAKAGCAKEAIALAGEMAGDKIVFSWTLEEIAPYLTESLLETAEVAFRHGFETEPPFSQRASVLKALALRWSQLGHNQRALKVVRSINPFDRDSALHELVRQFKRSPGSDVLIELLEEARRRNYGAYFSAQLIPFLVEEGGSERALREARLLELPHRISALLGVAAHTGGQERSEVMAEVMSIIDGANGHQPSLVVTLVKKAKWLPDPLRSEVAQKARSIVIEEQKNILTLDLSISLAELLPAEDRHSVCQKALDEIMTKEMDYSVTPHLRDLAEHLDKTQLDRLRGKVSRIDNDYDQARALTSILPRYAQLGRVVEALERRSSIQAT
jgi:tetratricopeptide (TPR) repeat protein